MNYTKADLQQIAEDMIKELRECEDGTVTTTGMLAKDCGYDVEFDDLFVLHDALFKAARANKIKLDMSEHRGRLEGLPFNLTFVVKNKKAQIKCPYCGSTDTARYLYGYPAFTEKMQKKLEEGKWKLGGCCLDAVEINGDLVRTMPARYCNACKKDFATPPILIIPKKEKAEDYRDIVKAIKFSIQGHFYGYSEVSIRKNDKGAIVKVQRMGGPEGFEEPKQISHAKWQKIVNTLYEQLYLHEWKRKYAETVMDVSDGIQWKLEIHLTDQRVRHYYGDNAFPAYWEELKKLFSGYVKL